MKTAVYPVDVTGMKPGNARTQEEKSGNGELFSNVTPWRKGAAGELENGTKERGRMWGESRT